MAKLKIKGAQELLLVPDDDAKRAINQKESGQVDNESFIRIGSFYGQVKNITAILFNEQETDMGKVHNKKYIEFYTERENIIKNSTDEQLGKKNEGWFKFVCNSVGYKPSEEEVQRAGKWAAGNLKKHQGRLWADPSDWLLKLKERGFTEGNLGFRIVELVDKNEMQAERYELEKLESLMKS